MRAGIQEIRSPALTPFSRGMKTPNHAHQKRRTLRHGAIDHLTLAGLVRMQQCADHAEREQHAAAAKVTDHIDRWRGLFACAPECSKGARQRDVVYVVTSGAREAARLSPASHPSVHEMRCI